MSEEQGEINSGKIFNKLHPGNVNEDLSRIGVNNYL